MGVITTMKNNINWISQEKQNLPNINLTIIRFTEMEVRKAIVSVLMAIE